MTEVFSAALLTIGSLFLLLAAIGITRMPDLLMRMQAATKAATLGVGCMLLAVALYFHDFGVAMRALLVINFFFMTAPVAAHMIGRAAYFVGVPLWERTIVDELHGRYDRQTHTLQSLPLDYSAGTVSQPGHNGPEPEGSY
jgi:multicomponent Na+:H+ antiporter subunit G